MRFWLGTHKAVWLERLDVPLFVSHRTLRNRVRLPRAVTPWALDSGAFTEVASLGHYETSPKQYVAAVRRYRDEVGMLEWAAPQDHMCEPWVIAHSKIADTVLQAQGWTVRNLIDLRSLAPELPIIPVLQGQTMADYLACVELYERCGVDLRKEPLVGVGSVCRRQATEEIAALLSTLQGLGLNLHGFGVKTLGLRRYCWLLDSADSMAWSYDGRRIKPCPKHGVVSCGNCVHHALSWRERALDFSPRPVQGALL